MNTLYTVLSLCVFQETEIENVCVLNDCINRINRLCSEVLFFILYTLHDFEVKILCMLLW